MNRFPVSRKMLPILVAMATFSVPQTQAADVAVAKRLPPETYAVLTIPDVAALKERFGDTQFGQMLADKSLDDFKLDINRLMEMGAAQIRRETGLELKELLQIPTGEISVAFVHPKGSKPAFAGFLNFGTSGETVEKLLALGRKAAEAQGITRDTKEVDDVKVVSYQVSEKQQLCYFIKDKTIVVSNRVDVLEKILARWDGKHEKTLASVESYKYIIERTQTDGRSAAMLWYVNPIEIIRSIIFSIDDAPPGAAMALGFLPALGIDKFKAVGGSVDMATEKYDSVVKMVGYIDGPATGALKVLSFPAVKQAPPSWVTADVTAYMQFNWDIAAAYKAVESLVDQFVGPGAFAKQVERAAESGPKIHPKKDVVDNLSGRIHIVMDLPDADDITSQRIMGAFGLTDGDAFAEVLAKVSKMPGFPGETREFKGTTIYEITAPGATVGMAVAHGHLFITNKVTLLEQVIRGDSERKALVDSAAYKSIASKLPAKSSLMSYERSESQVRAMYQMLRGGSFPLPVPGIDFGKLPEFKKLSKYFSAPQGSYAGPDKHGFYMESFSLRK